MSNPQKITVVGAGLVGSLLAIFLARRGFSVEVLERRPDMRKHAISAGRSINLAISTRGINALKKLNLDQEILRYAIPMKGRMVHSQTGELNFQPYGTEESDYINSISRATLNKVLMDQAESTGLVTFRFNTKVSGIEFDTTTLELVDEQSGQTEKHPAEIVIGTDGSASAIRQSMMNLPGHDSTQSILDYGYKELVIQPAEGGGFRLEKNALHIWPRGTYMLIALPNFEGSFTCTLFLPFKGSQSFEKLVDGGAVSAFFNEQFPDAVPLLSDLEGTFFENPTGTMTTIKCQRWNVGGKVLLLGDAAHGIVPFFGQGMNCGFEDCTVLEETIDSFTKGGVIDWQGLFDELSKERVPNTNAIADMAVENFVEMRDKVGDANFVLEKTVEKILQKKFPGRYISRYGLVTFSNVPYVVALEAGIRCEHILKQLCAGLTDPENVDLRLAETLIEKNLAPLLVQYAKQVEAIGAH